MHQDKKSVRVEERQITTAKKWSPLLHASEDESGFFVDHKREGTVMIWNKREKLIGDWNAANTDEKYGSNGTVERTAR